MTRIEIIGGGIAGLTLAHAMRRPGWDVVVRERGRGARPVVDTAFGLWRPAMQAFEDIGLGPAVRRVGTTVSAATVRTADDRELVQTSGQDVVMVGRATLHRLLVDALPADVEWIADDVAELPESDVVVGADGARSVVRRIRWGAARAARAGGITVVRGVVDDDLSGGVVSEYWGDGALFGVTPLPGGRTNWFTAFGERRFGDTDQALRHVRRSAQAFPPRVGDVLDGATVEQALVSGIHVSRPTASFVRGNVVLIGDAAHAMTPNLGRGACDAIRDAVTLGALLTEHTPRRALSRYRTRRLLAPQVIRLTSSMATRVALACGRTARARDRVLAALP